MKKMFAIVAAAAATGFIVANAHASLLTAYLTETPVNSPNNGVYTVGVYAEVTGDATAGGDGGISGMEFSVDNATSDLANVSANTAPGPNKGKPVITWVGADSSDFSQIAPQASTSPLGGADAASFYDTANFTKTTMGYNSPALIATYTFTLANNSIPAPLTLSIIGPTSYDFNSTNTNYQDNIGTINATGVTLPAVPEPASLSLLGLGAMGLIARRRKA